jgi:DNA-binding beta-propeller fold protein YncE
LAISADHKTAFVPLYGDGVYGNNPNPGHKIVAIDLATRKVSFTIDVSPYIAPHGLQVDSKGMLYATCDASRKILIIDPKTRTIEAAIDTEGTGHWAAVLPDGSKAYVANKNDRLFVSVIDLKSRKMVGRFQCRRVRRESRLHRTENTFWRLITPIRSSTSSIPPPTRSSIPSLSRRTP